MVTRDWVAGIRCLVCLGIAIVAGSLCSCSGGDSLNPVTGKVLYQKEPLAGALVTFHPKNSDDLNAPRPTGLTREDGSFTLATGEKQGAPTGEYTVTIICSEMPKRESKVIATGGVDTVDRLKGVYAERSNSRIHATVQSGDNQLEPFDLK